MRDQLLLSFMTVVIVGIIIVWIVKYIIKRLENEDRRVVIFSTLFFLITLLPFLGLGNITSRYSYLASVGFIIIFVLLIKKVYIFIEYNGKQIALMSTAIIIFLFSIFNIIQLQKIQGDWNTAGKKVNNFFDAIDASYQDYWTTEPMRFYFINVPIRSGEAWIFPVGLNDGLWLTLKNPSIEVIQTMSQEEALSSVKDLKHEKVYVFDDSGSVKEVIPDLSAYQQ